MAGAETVRMFAPEKVFGSIKDFCDGKWPVWAQLVTSLDSQC